MPRAGRVVVAPPPSAANSTDTAELRRQNEELRIERDQLQRRVAELETPPGGKYKIDRYNQSLETPWQGTLPWRLRYNLRVLGLFESEEAAMEKLAMHFAESQRGQASCRGLRKIGKKN